jgi:hypothetical protein
MVTTQGGIRGKPSVSDHSRVFLQNPKTSCDLGFTEPIFMTRNHSKGLGGGARNGIIRSSQVA